MGHHLVHTGSIARTADEMEGAEQAKGGSESDVGYDDERIGKHGAFLTGKDRLSGMVYSAGPSAVPGQSREMWPGRLG